MSAVLQHAGEVMNLPLSYLIRGISTRPENAAGIPMTRPEKVALPPRCSAYDEEEETIMKKVIYVKDHQHLFQRKKIVE